MAATPRDPHRQLHHRYHRSPRDNGATDAEGPRVGGDTRKVAHYYRASPDGQRSPFGGRASHNETNRASAVPGCMPNSRLRTGNSSRRHSWMGFWSHTFDEMMRAGDDGIHYAMGYCGSGVGMAGYLGMRVGQQVLGLKEGATAFDTRPSTADAIITAILVPLAPSIILSLARQCLPRVASARHA